MQILAISKLTEGSTMDKMGPHLASEIKHTLESYLDGYIRNFWFKGNKVGIVLMLECTDLDEAQSVLGEMPLVTAGFVEFDIIPLKPLMPLGTLIGRGM
jgi:hypothetical protein